MRERGIIIVLEKIIQQVGQKYRDKTTLASKTRSAAIVLVFKAGDFRYQWAITYSQ